MCAALAAVFVFFFGASSARATEIRTVEFFGFSDTATRGVDGTSADDFACGNTLPCELTFALTDASPTIHNALLDITAVGRGDATSLFVDVSLKAGMSCPAPGAGTSYTLAMDASAPKLFRIVHEAKTVITAGGTYCVYLEFRGGTAGLASLFSGKLILTYEHGSPSLLTAEFLATQDTSNPLACDAQIDPIFQTTLKETNLVIESAFLEIDGITATQRSTGFLSFSLMQDTESANFTNNVFEAVLSDSGGATLRPTRFHALKDGRTNPATVLAAHFPGIKNYKFSYRSGEDNLNDNDSCGGGAALASYIVSAKLIVTYKKTTGYLATGEVISSTFDTQVATGSGGPTYAGIAWKGSLPWTPTTKVRFQLATSAASGGPFTFSGPNVGSTTCNGATDWLEGGTPDSGNGVAAAKFPPICSAGYDNKRYFRYKMQLCASSDCASTSANTPQVDDVTVLWAP